MAKGNTIKNCGRCHTCGTSLRQVLDGEEWCPRCGQYRRYRSHGWTAEPGAAALVPCEWAPAENEVVEAAPSRRRKRMTDSDKARIEAMYEEGHTLAEIGDAVGYRRATITNYLIACGLHMVIPNRRPTSVRQKALTWYERGVPIEVITRQFNISHPTLYAWRRAAGVPLRYPNMSAGRQLRGSNE